MVLPGKAGGDYSVVSLDAAELAAAILAGSEKIVFRVHGLTGTATLEGAANHVEEVMRACGVPSGPRG
jgi:hypothetical protein